MRCQLHRFINRAEENEIHPINYFTSIRQDNDTVYAENQYMKIIMDIILYFICTHFWKIFCILWFQHCIILDDNNND